VVKPAVIVALVCAAELAQLDSASAETNISGNPFGLVLGYRYFDGAASHAVGNKLVATVAISCWDLDEYVRGWQLSATLPYYFRHAFSGPYLESGLIMRTAFVVWDDGTGTTADDKFSRVADLAPQVLLGWHWTADRGLNVSVAFGLVAGLDYEGATAANGYFRVGYAF
jgi:hypothetical protein